MKSTQGKRDDKMKKHIKIRRFEFFTMIELMAVLVIAAILLTLGASSFMKSRDNDATNRAASSFSGVLQQAQSNAVARRKSIALLVPDDDTFGPRGTVYRLCYLKKGTNEFESWLSEEWKKLPTNTLLAEVNNNAYDEAQDFEIKQSDTSLIREAITEIQKVRIDKDTTVDDIPGIVFSPAGDLKDAIEVNFYLIRGFMDENGALMIPNRTIFDGKPLDFIRIRLNPFTGKAKVIQ